MRPALEHLWQLLIQPEDKKQWRTGLAYTAWAVVCFLAFLVATFPHEVLLEALLARRMDGAARVDLDQVSFKIPFRYRVRKAKLWLASSADTPLLEAANLSIKPSLLALVRFRVTPARFDADVARGKLRTRLEIDPRHVAGEAAITDIDLSHWHGIRHWIDGRVSGVLNARVELDATLPGITRNTGSAELHVTGASIANGVLVSAGGLQIPDLRFQEITIKGTIKNGRVEIAEGTASGTEISASARGVIMLAEPLGLSALNVTLKLTPAPGAPAGLTMLLGMLPAPVGSQPGSERTLRLFGTIARPRLAVR